MTPYDKMVTIGSGNGLSPIRRQGITQTNWSMRHHKVKSNKTLPYDAMFSFEKMILKLLYVGSPRSWHEDRVVNKSGTVPKVYIRQTTFSNVISQWKSYSFGSNFTEVSSYGSNCQYVSIVSANGLSLNRRQTITWTNDDHYPRCHKPRWVNKLGPRERTVDCEVFCGCKTPYCQRHSIPAKGIQYRFSIFVKTLQWRHISVLNHRQLFCLSNSLLIIETSNLHVTFCVTGGFPSQRLSHTGGMLFHFMTSLWFKKSMPKGPSNYDDAIMGAIASQIISLIRPFIQAQVKKNINARRHWPLCGILIIKIKYKFQNDIDGLVQDCINSI